MGAASAADEGKESHDQNSHKLFQTESKFKHILIPLQPMSGCPDYSGARNSTDSGGRVNNKECGLPCAGIDSAVTPPTFPTSLPP